MAIYFASHPEIRSGYFAVSEVHIGQEQIIDIHQLPNHELPVFLQETFSPQVSLKTHMKFLEEAIDLLEIWKDNDTFLFFSSHDMTARFREKLDLLFRMINITLFNLAFKTSAQIDQALLKGSIEYFDENPLPTQ